MGTTRRSPEDPPARRTSDSQADVARVQRSAVIDAPARDVWHLITDPDELSGWMGGAVELDVRVGGAGRFALGDDGEHAAVVTQVDPEHHLGLLWWHADDGEHSAVDLELEPIDENRTRVRVTETRAVESGVPQACTTPFGWLSATGMLAARVLTVR